MKKGWAVFIFMIFMAWVLGNPRVVDAGPDFWGSMNRQIDAKIPKSNLFKNQLRPEINRGVTPSPRSAWGPIRRHEIPFDHSLLRGSYSLHAKFPNELFMDIKTDIWNQKTYAVVSALNTSVALDIPSGEEDLTVLRNFRADRDIFCSDLDAAPGGMIVGCIGKDGVRHYPFYFAYQSPSRGREGVWVDSTEDTNTVENGGKVKVAICNSRQWAMAWDQEDEAGEGGYYLQTWSTSDPNWVRKRRLSGSENLLDIAMNGRCGLVMGTGTLNPVGDHLENNIKFLYFSNSEIPDIRETGTLAGPYSVEAFAPYSKFIPFINPRNIHESRFLVSLNSVRHGFPGSRYPPEHRISFLITSPLDDYDRSSGAFMGAFNVASTLKSIDMDSNLQGKVYVAYALEESSGSYPCIKSYINHMDFQSPEYLDTHRLSYVPSTPEILGEGCGNSHPAVAVDPLGHVIVTWQKKNLDGSYSVYAKYFDPDSDVWSPEQKLSDAGDARYPRATIAVSGEATVAWINVTPESGNAAFETRTRRAPE